MILLINFGLDPLYYFTNTPSVSAWIVIGKKTVPTIECFILPGIPSILLQITCIKAYLKAKMT
jgi:hypothetical protein